MAPRSTVVGLKVKPRVTELKYFPTALSLKVSGMRVASWLASVNSPITKSTMVSGARVSQKATELRFGLMVVDTKATGIRVNPSEKELKLTLMAQRKKENGKAEHLLFLKIYKQAIPSTKLSSMRQNQSMQVKWVLQAPNKLPPRLQRLGTQLMSVSPQ